MSKYLYVTIEVKGNYARVINKFVENGIDVGKLKLGIGTFRINISSNLCKKAFAILDKMCYNYTVIKDNGVTNRFRYLRLRLGLLVGLVLGIAFVIMATSYVWRIDISGNSKITDKQLYTMLQEDSLTVGSRISTINVKDIESKLLTGDVINASIHIEGVVVKVDIVEKLDYDAPDMSNLTENIVSKYDCTITKIVNKQGTSNVSIGQHIAKGGVLISGFVNNTAGEKMYDCRAKGDIYGNVVFTSSQMIANQKEIKVRTGNHITHTILSMFGLSVGLDITPDYLSYDTEHSKIYVSSGMLLPIMADTITYYETKTETIDVDTNVKAKELTQNYVDSIAIKYGKTYTVDSEVTQVGDMLRLDIFVKMELNIGVAVGTYDQN